MGSISKRKTVVIVDDDRDVASSLRFLLETEGFDVVTFESGMELLAAPLSMLQGCLVIDYRMPNMSGLELLKELREKRILLPAIFITAYPDSALPIQATLLGATCILFKPGFQKDLLLCLHKALDRMNIQQ